MIKLGSLAGIFSSRASSPLGASLPNVALLMLRIAPFHTDADVCKLFLICRRAQLRQGGGVTWGLPRAALRSTSSYHSISHEWGLGLTVREQLCLRTSPLSFWIDNHRGLKGETICSTTSPNMWAHCERAGSASSLDSGRETGLERNVVSGNRDATCFQAPRPSGLADLIAIPPSTLNVYLWSLCPT